MNRKALRKHPQECEYPGKSPKPPAGHLRRPLRILQPRGALAPAARPPRPAPLCSLRIAKSAGPAGAAWIRRTPPSDRPDDHPGGERPRRPKGTVAGPIGCGSGNSSRVAVSVAGHRRRPGLGRLPGAGFWLQADRPLALPHLGAARLLSGANRRREGKVPLETVQNPQNAAKIDLSAIRAILKSIRRKS